MIRGMVKLQIYGVLSVFLQSSSNESGIIRNMYPIAKFHAIGSKGVHSLLLHLKIKRMGEGFGKEREKYWSIKLF